MEQVSYTNPVWDGYFADPFVMKHDGEYWAYGTGSAAPDGREFPVLRSKDLVHWSYAGGALVPLSRRVRREYWAPEVAYRNGTFYLYYSTGLLYYSGPNGEHEKHHLRVATSQHPAGPFHDAGKVLFPNEEFTIDAHPFRDPADGQWYLFFAKDFFDKRIGTGLAVVPLADDMMTPIGEPRECIRPTADWQIFAHDHPHCKGSAWHTVEGPFVVYRRGLYYCLYSGGCWETPHYGVGYGVAKHPLGPWCDDWNYEGPAVLRGVPGRVHGPGHNSVVTGPDGKTQFIVYHAWDAAHTARRMCIDPLIWTPDGPRCAGPTWEAQTVRVPSRRPEKRPAAPLSSRIVWQPS
jgi:GH43 family beta-xylosidase